MTQYYVNPSGGNNSNSGLSTSQAWATINYAKTNVSAGDVVNLMSGSYGSVTWTGSDDKGNFSNHITFQGYPGDPAHSATFTHMTFTSNYDWYIDIRNIEVYASSGTWGALEINAGSAYIYVYDSKIHGPMNSGAHNVTACCYLTDFHHVVLDGNEFYGAHYAVQMTYSGEITVSHNYVHDICASGFRVGDANGGSSSIVFEYNVIHTQRRLDWYPEDHGSAFSLRGSNVTVRGNIIYNYANTRPIRTYQFGDQGPYGNITSGYQNMTIENNVVYCFENEWTHPNTMWWIEFLEIGVNFVFRNNTVGDYYRAWDGDCGLDSSVEVSANQYSHCSSWKIYNNLIESELKIWVPSSTAGNIQEGGNIVASLRTSSGSHSSFGAVWPGSDSEIHAKGSWWGEGNLFEDKELHAPFSSAWPFELCAGSHAINFGVTSEAPALDLLERSRVGSADCGAYEYDGEPPAEPETLYISVSDGIDVDETTSRQKEGGIYQVDVSESVTVDETQIADVGPKKVNVSNSISVVDTLTVDEPEGETALKFVSVVDTIIIAESLPDRYVFGPVLLTIDVIESITIQEAPKAVNESLLGGGFPNWYLTTTDGSYASGKAYTSDDAGENWNEITPTDADFAIRVYGAAIESDVFEINITEPVLVGEAVDREAKSADLHLAYPASTITVADTVALSVIGSLGVQPVDSISVVETITLLRTTLREIDIADTVYVAETTNIAKSLDISVVDTTSVAESIQQLITLNISISDFIAITESTDRNILLLFASLTDVVGVHDYAPTHLSEQTYVENVDSVNVVETISAWISGVDALAAELITVAETLALVKAGGLYKVDVSDTVSVAEPVTLVKAGGLYEVDVADTISVAETAAPVLSTLFISEIDSILVTDEILRIFQNPIKAELIESVAVQDVLSRLNVNPLEFYADDDIAVSDWGDSEKIAILKEATDLVTVGETIDLRISRPGWAKRPPRKPHPIHPRDVRYS